MLIENGVQVGGKRKNTFTVSPNTPPVMFPTESERERERERQTDRQTDRQRDRQRDRELVR